jgi:hypothetical protein
LQAFTLGINKKTAREKAKEAEEAKRKVKKTYIFISSPMIVTV